MAPEPVVEPPVQPAVESSVEPAATVAPLPGDAMAVAADDPAARDAAAAESARLAQQAQVFAQACATADPGAAPLAFVPSAETGAVDPAAPVAANEPAPAEPVAA